MNRYTVGKATLGLANYLKSTGKADLKVAIAYDSRNNSADFAKTAAGILQTAACRCICTTGWCRCRCCLLPPGICTVTQG